MSADVSRLTPRQKEILRLLLKGFDAKSVGLELGISVHTVNEHLKEARRVLEASSSREAARVLQSAEGSSPILSGPKELGVSCASGRMPSTPRRRAYSRLAYAGGVLMILGIAVAIGLSLADDSHQRSSNSVSARAEQNPSPYKSRELTLGNFDRLKVSGPFKVIVFVGPAARSIAGGDTKVELLGPPELLADTIATVESGLLTIRFREGAQWSWNPGSGMNVGVFVPTLTAAQLDGSGSIEIHGVTGDKFSASTAGAGGIDLHDVEARRVQLSTAGAGGISAQGNALEVTYTVGGAGSIDAKRMRANNATITVNGSGDAFADVSDTANVSVNGHGRIQVVGGANCVKRPPNSPRVECR